EATQGDVPGRNGNHDRRQGPAGDSDRLPGACRARLWQPPGGHLQPLRIRLPLAVPGSGLGKGARPGQRLAQRQARAPQPAAEAGRRRHRGRARRQQPCADSGQPSQRGWHREEGGAAGHGRQVRTVERAGAPRADPSDDPGRRDHRGHARAQAVTGMAGSRGAAPPSQLPVMWAQVMEGLRVRRDGRYLDGTFGRGGHARGVLDRLGPDGRLLVMDKDPEAIATAHALFGADGRVAARRGSFAGMAEWDDAAAGLDGILFDLGVSSPQLDVAERCFSFGKDGPLDMRMDPDAGESAANWLARADEREIADVLWAYGEEKLSRKIARTIVARRDDEPLLRTGQLA